MKALVVKAAWMVKLAGFLSVGVKGWREAKAVTLFPFIFVRDWQYATPVILNHEKIHLAQQAETLLLGMLLLNVAEDVYARLAHKKSPTERYLCRATELEAYLNQEDLNYLKTRKRYAFVRNLFHKQDITFDPKRGAPYVTVLKQ